jgi:hypothetical protein
MSGRLRAVHGLAVHHAVGLADPGGPQPHTEEPGDPGDQGRDSQSHCGRGDLYARDSPPDAVPGGSAGPDIFCAPAAQNHGHLANLPGPAATSGPGRPRSSVQAEPQASVSASSASFYCVCWIDRRPLCALPGLDRVNATARGDPPAAIVLLRTRRAADGCTAPVIRKSIRAAPKSPASLLLP